MNLMLAIMFLCVALGLVAGRFGRREYCLITLMATAMTLLYWLFGERFM
jgi:hypothetical protein